MRLLLRDRGRYACTKSSRDGLGVQIGVCMTLSVCGLGVRNAPSPVVCHAHCPAGAVSVQGKNQTNPYSYITVERRSERTAST